MKRSGKVSINATGLCCLIIWVAMFQIPETPIFRLMGKFAYSDEAGYLFSAAGALVLLNTMRAIPLYVGCFYLGEGLSRYGGILPLAIIPLSYYLFGLFFGGKGHHFGMPSVMAFIIVFILQLLIWNVPGRFNRSLALCLFLFSFQWLNLAPVLTRYGFGQGELSWTIKNLASLGNFSSSLNLLALGGFIVAFIGALMTVALLINTNLNVRQFRRLMEQNETLASLREDSLRARMVYEIQSLVHDLRRPLTSIQGLVDVLATISTAPNAREYADRAGMAAENMGHMIDEILHENGRSLIDARELLSYTVSQVSPLPWHRYVRIDPCVSEAVHFQGNKIRISRALVNLMENASHALQGASEPQITIKYFLEGNFIKFSVHDNGPGLTEDIVVGKSGHGSTGMGLAVAQRVAENHEGAFTLKNHPGGGAEAVLSLSLNSKKTMVSTGHEMKYYMRPINLRKD